MELQVGVKILLKNSEGKYLLLRRDPSKYPEIGAQWDLVGGRIEAGVPLIENLRREVMEETGLTLIGAPKLIAAQDILRQEGRHVVRLTYIGSAVGKTKISAEHSEYRWFEADDLPEEADPYLKEIIKEEVLS